YIGVMKGVITNVNPAANIIDLCHHVSSQDVREGSFILGSSYAFFPRGTIFVAVVDPGVGSDRKNLIVTTEDYCFVAPDNGILTSIFEGAKVERVYQVVPGKYTLAPRGSTFFGRDIFAPVAAHLSLGVLPGEMGSEVKSVLTVPAIRPYVNEHGEISGRAVYVDTFGNIITNVEEAYLASVFPGKVQRDDLVIRLAGQRIKGIRKYYEQGECGKLVAIVNSWGYVEIAVNRGSAFQYLGLKEKKSLEIFISAAV
ncbi:MAG: SAM-dependent chlorinase/fluorinase, partial [Candidatus Krumholzibacteriaceae bacterium]